MSQETCHQSTFKLQKQNAKTAKISLFKESLIFKNKLIKRV